VASSPGEQSHLALCTGLITESLEQRVDQALALLTRLRERNEILSQRVQKLEQEVQEAFWVDDEARIERDHYEWLLRVYGINPWRIPGAEDEAG
jgi:hypothetical protein